MACAAWACARGACRRIQREVVPVAGALALSMLDVAPGAVVVPDVPEVLVEPIELPVVPACELSVVLGAGEVVVLVPVLAVVELVGSVDPVVVAVSSRRLQAVSDAAATNAIVLSWAIFKRFIERSPLEKKKQWIEQATVRFP